MGTWQLGTGNDWDSIDESEAVRMIHTALELGINFFDTAPNYGLGSSERRIGKALAGIDRERFVINTKFGHSANGSLNFDADAMAGSLAGSLERMRLDHVDSIILHNPPREILEGKTEHFNILEALKDEGLIRAYGASVDTYEDMMLLMDNSDSEVIETFFNILHQDTARAFDTALKNDIAIIAKIPLDSGWLSGKYHSGSTFDDVRARWTKEDIKIRAALVDRIREIIGRDRDLVQSALSFCLSHEGVTTVIPGSSSVSQLKQNAGSSSDLLTEGQILELKKFYQEEVKPLGLPW